MGHVPYNSFHKTIAGHIAAALKKAKIYEEETQRRKALEELFDIKNTFLNKIGHDLQRPLLFILGILEDVLSDSDKLASRQLERLVLIKNSLLSLKKAGDFLADLPNLSKISKIERDSIDSHYEALDIMKITTEIINLLHNSIARIKAALP